jgi:hypothetical protein
MTGIPFDKDRLEPGVPDDLLDKAAERLEEAARAIGMTPSDRMYVFYQCLMILVRALIETERANRATHARQIEITRERFEASLKTTERQITQIGDALKQQVLAQKAQGDRYIAELSRRADVILAKHSIQDESRAFFEELRETLHNHSKNIEAVTHKHVKALYDVTYQLKDDIDVKTANLAKIIAVDVSRKLQEPDVIPNAFLNKFTEHQVDMFFKVVKDNFLGVVVAMGVLVGFGFLVRVFTAPAPSLPIHAAPSAPIVGQGP